MASVGNSGSGGRKGDGQRYQGRMGGCFGSGGAPGRNEARKEGESGDQNRPSGSDMSIPFRGPKIPSHGQPYMIRSGRVAKHQDLTAQQKRAKMWNRRRRTAEKQGRTEQNKTEWSRQQMLDRLARQGKLLLDEWEPLIPTFHVSLDWEPEMPTVRVDIDAPEDEFHVEMVDLVHENLEANQRGEVVVAVDAEQPGPSVSAAELNVFCVPIPKQELPSLAMLFEPTPPPPPRQPLEPREDASDVKVVTLDSDDDQE